MPSHKIKLVKSAFLHETETRRALADFVMRTEVFSMNVECHNFEKAFAAKQERAFAVFVNSGSSANLILVQSLLNLGRLKRGDRVGVSALTWSTNVIPLIQLGLIPVVIDCEMSTLNISSATLKPLIKTLQGLFVTNALGFCGAMAEIVRMCQASTAWSFSRIIASRSVRAHMAHCFGNFGVAGTFSFFLGHHLSTLEGGMVCTDDEELYHMLIMVRAHGWDRHLPSHAQTHLRKKHDTNDFYALYTFYELGYNLRPTEIKMAFWATARSAIGMRLWSARVDNFNRFQAAARENPSNCAA